LPSLKQHLAAIAIVFDFVNPVLALRRLIDRGSELGLNELEPSFYKRHGHFDALAGFALPGLGPIKQAIEERTTSL